MQNYQIKCLYILLIFFAPTAVIYAQENPLNHSFQIRNIEDFNHFATELRYLRDPGIYVIVPKYPEIDKFCQPFTNCPRKPVFLVYPEENHGRAEAIFTIFKNIYPEALGRLSYDDWVKMTQSPEQRLFYECSVHKILQANQDSYGFDCGVVHDGYGWEPFLEIFTYEETLSIYRQLLESFGLRPLYYYPRALNPGRVELAKSWQKPVFNIFYETLFLPHIGSEEQLNWLVRTDISSQRMIAAVSKPQARDFCLKLQAQGINCLDQPIYSAVYMHPDIFFIGFPRMFPNIGREDWGRIINLAYNEGGLYYAITLIKGVKDNLFRFSIPYLSCNESSLDVVRYIYQALNNTFDAGQLVLMGDTVCGAKDWKDPGFLIEFGNEIPDFNYEAYTTGTALGRLKILNLETFENLRQSNGISWQDFLIFDEAPFDVETPVVGTITGFQQEALASHLALRMARRNAPNAYVKDAIMKFQEYDNQLVKVTILEDDFKIEPTSPEEAQVFWNETRPKIKPPKAIDRTFGEFERLTEMTDEPTTRFSRYGGKASNLSKLYQFLDPAMQLEGFAIPFRYFYEFMKNNSLDEEFFEKKDHITSVLPPITYFDYVHSLHLDALFNSDLAFRAKVLDDFRDHIRDHGIVDTLLIQSLRERIKALWNANEKGYYKDRPDEPVRVRFRSSSNMEDAVEFNGAGLYESKTVCLPDELDQDAQGPSLCSDDKEEQTIERAFKRVLRSLYEDRAYNERDYYQLPQDKAAMAILVNTGKNDELSNGVAFTGNPGGPQSPLIDYKYFAVTAQTGETSVVDLQPGIIPETNLIKISRDTEIKNILHIQSSSLVKEGMRVISDNNMINMGNTLLNIEQKFPLDRGLYSPERIIYDLEFKYIPKFAGDTSGQLILKQIRPFLIGSVLRYLGNDSAPLAAINLRVYRLTHRQVHLQWNKPNENNADLVIIERSDGNDEEFKPIFTLSDDVETFIDFNIEKGKKYQYRIILENGFGESKPSNIVFVDIPNAPVFLRGDSNNDEKVNISDPIYTLLHLFSTGPEPVCKDAADANDDGSINISDPILTLTFLFFSNPASLPTPYPDPGIDPTFDEIGCDL